MRNSATKKKERTGQAQGKGDESASDERRMPWPRDEQTGRVLQSPGLSGKFGL